MKTIARRAVTATAAGALMLGGAITMAPSASAATSSSCTESAKLNTDVSSTVKFRTGPGTKYTAKGQLSRGTDVYWACTKGSAGSAKSWGYVKALSGAHKGEKGWVARTYINTPMQLD